MDNTITISDLIVLRNALDLASTRGAFRGTELSTVGGLFDKLSAFLADIEAQAEAQAAADAGEAGESSEESTDSEE